MNEESDDERARSLHYQINAAMYAVGVMSAIKQLNKEMPIPTFFTTTMCVYGIIGFVRNATAAKRQ